MMTQNNETPEKIQASTVRLPESVWEKAQILAVKRRVGFNDILVAAIRQYLLENPEESDTAALTQS